MARPSGPVEFDNIEELLDTSVTFDTIAVLVVAKEISLEAIVFRF